MTQPSGGFRVAEGFIDVKARVDRSQVTRAGREAGDSFGENVVQSARDRIDRRKDLLAQELGRAGERAGREAGERLAEGFFRDQQGKLRDNRGRFAALTEGIERQAADAGRKFSSGFVDLVTGNMSGALKQPWIATAIASGILAGAPLIGGALSGAIVGGIGALGLGGAVALAFMDAEGPARKAASDLGKSIMADLQGIGDMFQGEAAFMMQILSDEWELRFPDLRTGLESLLGYVEPVTRGIARGLGAIVSGISTAMQRSGPLLLMLGQEFAETGEAVQQFLELISEDLDGGLLALKVVFEGLQGTIIAFGYIIRGLSVVFEGLVMMMDAVHDRVIQNDTAIVALMGAIPGLAEGGDRLMAWLEEIKRQSEEYEGTGRSAAQATNVWGDSMYLLRDKTKETVTQNDLMNASMTESIRLMGDLSAVLDFLVGRNVDAREAEANYQEAVDKANEAIKKKITSINLETEIGREYDKLLRDIARASERVATTAYEQAEAAGSVAAGELAAAAAMYRGREQLVRSLVQMGMNEREARRYADSIIKIPKRWETFVDARNVPQARNDMEAYKRFINSIPREVITYFDARAIQGFGAKGSAWGDVHQMAAGGVMAGIARNPTVLFGERNTEQEAFIPKRGNLMRSRQILDVAAGWLGMDVVPQNQNRNARMSNTPASPLGGSRDSGDQRVFVVAHFDLPTGPLTQIVEATVSNRPDSVGVSAQKGSLNRSTWFGFGRS